MKEIIGAILLLFGMICLAIGGILQQVLCYQMFGAIFKQIFIPHWSALFYLGIIPMAIGSIMSGIELN